MNCRSFVSWIMFIRIICWWCSIIFNLVMSFLIVNILLINWEKAWSTKSPYCLKLILFLFLTSWNPCSYSLFWSNVGQPDSNCFFIYKWKKQKQQIVYFQVCNVLKILRNKNLLTHCIFHCKISPAINVWFLKCLGYHLKVFF